jgi:ribosomal protein L40E
MPVRAINLRRRPQEIALSVTSTEAVCLQCGTVANRASARVCRRCGLRFGAEPPSFARLAECPVCYRTTDPDGRLPSLARAGVRLDIAHHVEEHERYPVGDDAWLETLREHDRIRIGRWTAPFALVRRYLVTGVVDAGRNRLALHNAIVTAMTQLQRWGRDPEIMGDEPEWRAAREAIAEVMDRYHAPSSSLQHRTSVTW